MSGLQASHCLDSHQQVSFHFWNCQLTQACPEYSWDPENWATTATATATSDDADKGERRHRRLGDGDADAVADKPKESVDNETDKTKPDMKEPTGKESGDKITADSTATNNEAANGHKSGENSNRTANGGSNGEANGHANLKTDEDENAEEAATDADYMQHVLKVNACILGARASGVHLISVRTKCYLSEQPGTCPIVCIDPDSQRTLALGYEFVLDSQNEVTFELTEGTGPVWLTGLHQVRVHDAEDSGEGDGEEEEIDNSLEAIEPADEVIDKASRFFLANGNGVEQAEEAEVEEELMEERDGDSEGDSDASGDGQPAHGKRSPITTAQLRNRKRQRLENDESRDDH